MRWIWLSAALVSTSLSPAVGTASNVVSLDEAGRKVVLLTVDEPVEVPWGPDTDEIVVRVDLGEYDYNNVLVEQSGVDVAVTDPGSACDSDPWTVDLRRGSSGTEVVPVSRDADYPLPELVLSTKEVIGAEQGGTEPLVRLSIALSGSREHPGELCQGWRAFLNGMVLALESGEPSTLRALQEYRRSAGIFRSIQERGALGQILVNIGAAEHRLRRLDSALDHLSEARKLLEGIESYETSFFDALKEAALVFHRIGRTALAAKFFGDALEVARELDNPHLIATALNGLGVTHRSLGHWGEAIESFEQALDLASGDRCRESAVRINLGSIEVDRGRYQHALDQLRRSVDTSRGGNGDPACRHLPAALNSLAILYGRLGRHRIAAATYEEAIDHVDAVARIRLLHNLGFSRYLGGEIEAAGQAFRECALLAKASGDTLTEFAARTNLSRLFALDLDQPWSAREQLDRAARLIDSETPSRELSTLLAREAELDLASGAFEEALAHASRSLSIARTIGNPESEAMALHLAARGALGSGRLEQAAAFAEQGVSIAETLRSQTAGYDLRSSLLGEYGSHFAVWIRVLLALDEARPGADYLGRALEVAERARSRALLEMLDNAAVERSDDVDPALARLEQELEALFFERESREDVTDRHGIRSRLAEVQAKILERKAHLRTARPNWSELRSPTLLDISAIRDRILDDRTALLHSFVSDDASWVWLLTRKELKVWEIPGRAKLEADIRHLLDLLQAQSETLEGEDLEGRRQRIAEAKIQYRDASRRFSESLLAPVLTGLEAERILVVPDGPLAYLPVSALPAPGSAGHRPLVMDFEWILLPSISVLASIRSRARCDSDKRGVCDRMPSGMAEADTPRPTLAIVADPVFSRADPRLLESVGNSTGSVRGGLDRDFHRLPHTGEEAAALASLAGADTLMAIGFDATADLAKSGQLQPYRIVHFATHGVIDTEFPELSGLVFSLVDETGQPLDGILRLPDIYRLRLDSELVVLSACETALGRDIRGEGLVGLTRGFIYAGASSVVASLWTVQDRATRNLMTRFFRKHLHQGLSASTAFHEAQREMAADDRYSPYHWAGFVFQGDW